jgi:hypothetical protein
MKKTIQFRRIAGKKYLKRAMATSAAFMSVMACAKAQSVTVNVNSKSLWTKSIVQVAKGETITINANGNWSFRGKVNGIFDTVYGTGNVPDGISPALGSLFLDNDIQGSLIAYVGVSPHGPFPQPPGSGYWEIGSSGQFISDRSGSLWLGMNDDNVTPNDGSVNAQIFQGSGAINSDWKTIRPIVSNPVLSGTTFSFSITSATMPNSFWAVYDTTDLINWVLAGAVTLDDNGAGSFTNTIGMPFTGGVPYRFYKVCNGQTVSQVIGFAGVIMPPGYSIITCPLNVGTDTEYAGTFNGPAVANDLNVVLNNDVSIGCPYAGAEVLSFVNGKGFGNTDRGSGVSTGGGWQGGTLLPPGPSFGPSSSSSQSDIGQGIQLLPGQAVFFHNPGSLIGIPLNMTATFVGTLPDCSITNIIVPGYNLIGSQLPVAGDFVLNSISGQFFANTVNQNGSGGHYQAGGNLGPANEDVVFFYDTTVVNGQQLGYGGPGCTAAWEFGSWSGGAYYNPTTQLGDPGTINNGGLTQGFFYFCGGNDNAPAQTINGFNAPAGTELMVETFSVTP